MACEDLNKSISEIEDLLRNKNFRLNIDKESSLTDKIKAFKFFNENLYIPDTVNGSPNNRYYIGDTEIEGRVSDKAKKNFERKYGKEAAERMARSPVNELKREAGSTIHEILQDILNSNTNKENSKSLNQIVQDAQNGEYGVSLNLKDVNALMDWSKDFLNRIYEQQKRIDPDGEVQIFTEQKILDPFKNRGGAIDILAVFSDHSASIYDYKTSTPSRYAVRGTGKKATLVDTLATEGKIESYTLTIEDYKRILLEHFGIRKFNESRAIPIHIQLAKEGKEYKNHLDLVQIGEQTSKHLMEIPIGEKTKFKGLDNLLEKQLSLVSTLEETLQKKGLSQNDKDLLRARIRAIRKSVRRAVVKGEVDTIFSDARGLVLKFGKKLEEPDTLSNGEPNPNKLTLIDIATFMEESAVYEGITEDTSEYIQNLKLIEPEVAERLVNQRRALYDRIADLREQARSKRESMILERIPDNYKDENGDLIALDGVKYITRNFLNLSEIDHPIFQAFNDLKNETYYDVTMEMRTFFEELEKVDADLRRWGKKAGLSKGQIFSKIINQKTGNLYSQLTKEFWEERQDAFNNDDYEWLIERYEFRDFEEFKKEYNQRLEEFQARLKIDKNNFEPILDEDGTVIQSSKSLRNEYNKELKQWKSRWDLVTKKGAYLNRTNYKHLKLKPEYEQQYKSDEFKYIENNEALLNYYNFFTSKIDEFRDLLGLQYSDIPNNFIPKIRKSAVEHLVDNGSIKKTFQEIYRDLVSVREEDVHISQIDPLTGQPVKKIPRLFLHPFKDNDGRIDVSEQSKDLSKVLTLFAKMSYNYDAMSKIEAQTLAFKDLMGDSSVQQAGETVTSTLGKAIKGNFKDPLNTKSKNTATYKLFEQITDYYMYGIKFREGSISKKYNTTKALLTLKQYMSRKALAFAVIPGIGAYIAGKLNTRLEAAKGVSFTIDQGRQANKYMVGKSRKKYKAINAYFHAYAEDESNVMVSKITNNKIIKYVDDRYLFWPLRGTDEKLTEHVLVSMSQNYAVDENGKLLRLNKPEIDASKYTTIWENTTYDPETGEISIDGMTKDAFIMFRAAVKNTMNNIIGNMSAEDIGASDVNLGLNLMMQFKTWMPGVLKERFGNITYDRYIQSLRQGRYKAYFSTYSSVETVRNGVGLGYFARKILVPNLGKLALDVATFGFSNKSYNKKLARLQYHKWREANPAKAKEVSEAEFLEMKRGQIKAMVNEVRAILLFYALITMLGSDGDGDGEPLYADNQFTRTMYKAFAKSYSELSFAWTPREFIRLVSNPLPMSQLLEDASKTIGNTFDEGRDLMFGENSPQDKSPFFYYTSQWAYGGTQLARLLELFETYKKADYL